MAGFCCFEGFIMVFKKREENGGEVDPNINTTGRPEKKKRKITRREAKDQTLLSLARKLNPCLGAAIREAKRILDDEDAKDEAKLRASALFLKTFQDVVNELYQDDPEPKVVTVTKEVAVESKEVEVQEIQPKVDNRPIFSLRVINNPDDFKLGSEEE